MDISGSRRILAPRDAVWTALHDPDVLAVCIPGCERIEKTAEGVYDGAMAAKVGPLRTLFEGRLAVTQALAPERCVITVSAKDATAGAGEGRGEVTLIEEGDETVLTYEGGFEVEGKIGQLGPRLVTGFARQAIESFFTKFTDLAAEGEDLAERGARRVAAPPLAEAPPLVHEEPGASPAPVMAAPPLAGGAALQQPKPIAPTATPDPPDPAAIAAAETAGGGGAMLRIMLVAAIVIVVGAAVYWAFLQPPV